MKIVTYCNVQYFSFFVAHFSLNLPTTAGTTATKATATKAAKTAAATATAP
jgi:hypothetical protein